MRYATTLVLAFNTPCELIPPGDGWRYRDMVVRDDRALVVVWETDNPAPICPCGNPSCRPAVYA
jgi:hypothetical protein